MTSGQLDTTIAELIRALDERKPDCMCQVSPRTAAVALAHFQSLARNPSTTIDSAAALRIIDKWMAGFDHVGTGTMADANISESEWLKDRQDLVAILSGKQP